MATAKSESEFEFDFFISSSCNNADWVEEITEYLESKHLKGVDRKLQGVNENRDKLGGMPVMMLAQYYIESSKKIIFGFDAHDERENFKSLQTLEDMFYRNDRKYINRLIPVKLFPDSCLPEFLQHLHALEAQDPKFYDQLFNSVIFTPHQLHTKCPKPKTYNKSVPCTDGSSENSKKQVVATQDSPKEPSTESTHQGLQQWTEDFVKGFPFQEIHNSMNEVFSVEERSRIQMQGLSDCNERQLLITILLKERPEAFVKFLKAVKSYLDKHVEKDSTGSSHEELVQKYKDGFAKDLQYQKVLDRMPDVFSPREKSDIRRQSLSDFDKSRQLVAVLSTKGFEVFTKFVEVLLNLHKPVQEGSTSEEELREQVEALQV
ncbi:uncharacterized protein [Ptychodera flava]|uniref:uncharacterized protein isoform X2 n=1 Tax=Ptychodera flava TaxID=63121 RepID=UPI00396A1ED7